MGRKDPAKLHVRRCHVCGAVTERKIVNVERCERCGKSLVPFLFYKEEQAPTFAAELERPPLMKGELRPVIGLSALWGLSRVSRPRT